MMCLLSKDESAVVNVVAASGFGRDTPDLHGIFVLAATSRAARSRKYTHLMPVSHSVLTSYPQVDMLGPRHKFVIFGAKNTPDSPNRRDKID